MQQADKCMVLLLILPVVLSYWGLVHSLTVTYPPTLMPHPKSCNDLCTDYLTGVGGRRLLGFSPKLSKGTSCVSTPRGTLSGIPFATSSSSGPQFGCVAAQASVVITDIRLCSLTISRMLQPHPATLVSLEEILPSLPVTGRFSLPLVLSAQMSLRFFSRFPFIPFTCLERFQLLTNQVVFLPLHQPHIQFHCH